VFKTKSISNKDPVVLKALKDVLFQNFLTYLYNEMLKSQLKGKSITNTKDTSLTFFVQS